jgi:hypothetical protein
VGPSFIVSGFGGLMFDGLCVSTGGDAIALTSGWACPFRSFFFDMVAPPTACYAFILTQIDSRSSFA